MIALGFRIYDNIPKGKQTLQTPSVEAFRQGTKERAKQTTLCLSRTPCSLPTCLNSSLILKLLVLTPTGGVDQSKAQDVHFYPPSGRENGLRSISVSA
jgi:hypothetical protein